MAEQDTYTVERSALIAAGAEEIYPHLEDFRRWPAWSPWEDTDPGMSRRYSGAERGAGAVYEWHGNRKAGEGRMEIVTAEPSTRLVLTLAFLKPFKSTSTTTFSLEPASDGAATKVTWSMVGPRTRMLKVMSLVTSMDKLVGGDFEKGLTRLTALVEAPAA